MPPATRTAKGLRRILLGLAVTLVISVFWTAIDLAFRTIPGFGLDLNQRQAISWISSFVPVGAFAIGALGVRALWSGKEELGASHVVALRRGLRVLIITAVSAAVFLAIGLALGYVRISGTSLTLLSSVHAVAALVLALSLGMFLFWSIRDLGTAETAFLAGAALAFGALSAIQTLVQASVGVPAYLLNGASIGLWIAAYMGAYLRLDRSFPQQGTKPATA